MEFSSVLENIFAGTVVLVCCALLVRQFIGAPRRSRLDARLRRCAQALQATSAHLLRWPAARRAARREAVDTIRRARGERSEAEHDGNVIRPKAFRKPRKLH